MIIQIVSSDTNHVHTLSPKSGIIAYSFVREVHWNIIVAENGQVAVDKLVQFNVSDILLMDVMIPVMNDYKAK